MEEIFNVVSYFYKDDKKVMLLKHDNMKYYYYLFETTENNYRYPTMEEFVDLNKMMILNRALLNIPNFDDRYKNCEARHKKILKKNQVKVCPKVVKNGIAILLTIPLIIHSYNVINIFKEIGNNENSSSYSVSVEENSTSVKREDVSKCGIENIVEYLEVQNPTWDQLIECAENNPSITGVYKDYINEGISNLRKNMPDLNLSILYYNLSNLKIIEVDDDTKDPRFTPRVRAKYAGRFVPKESTVYMTVNSSEKKDVFMHEFFGHASDILEIDYEDYCLNSSIRLCDSENLNYIPSSNNLGESIDGSYFTNNTIGFSFEEARSEMVAALALDKDIKEYTQYGLQVQELLILLNASGLTLTDISNKGLSVLVNKLYDMNINGYELINNSDEFLNAQRSNSFRVQDYYLVSNNIASFLSAYYNYLINDGYNHKEAIGVLNNIGEQSDVGGADSGFIYTDSFSINMYKNIVSSIGTEEEYSGIDLNTDNLVKNNLEYSK